MGKSTMEEQPEPRFGIRHLGYGRGQTWSVDKMLGVGVGESFFFNKLKGSYQRRFVDGGYLSLTYSLAYKHI